MEQNRRRIYHKEHTKEENKNYDSDENITDDSNDNNNSNSNNNNNNLNEDTINLDLKLDIDTLDIKKKTARFDIQSGKNLKNISKNSKKNEFGNSNRTNMIEWAQNRSKRIEQVMAERGWKPET